MTEDPITPKVREGLTLFERGASLFVHDRQGGRTHELNETAAAIFRGCDGSTPVSAVAARLASTSDVETSREIVHSALAQLARAGLFEGPYASSPGVSRRGFGSALLAPLVITVLTPGRAAAASTDGTDASDAGDHTSDASGIDGDTGSDASTDTDGVGGGNFADVAD